MLISFCFFVCVVSYYLLCECIVFIKSSYLIFILPIRNIGSLITLVKYRGVQILLSVFKLANLAKYSLQYDSNVQKITFLSVHCSLDDVCTHICVAKHICKLTGLPYFYLVKVQFEISISSNFVHEVLTINVVL